MMDRLAGIPLNKLGPQGAARAALARFVAVVADDIGVTVAVLTSRRRTAALAIPRMAAMAAARAMFDLQDAAIAAGFGRADSSSVVYSVRQVRRRVEVLAEARRLFKIFKASETRTNGNNLCATCGQPVNCCGQIGPGRVVPNLSTDYRHVIDQNQPVNLQPVKL